MYCKECGKQIAEDSKFCQSCGKPQDNVEIQLESLEELSLWGYYAKCFKDYANFEGRARRKEYWGFFLFDFIIISGLEVLDLILFGADRLTWLYILVAFLPRIGVAVRRLHDIGKSGWWVIVFFVISIISITNIILSSSYFWLFIFIIGITIIISLVWLITDSEYAENIYGANPKSSKPENISSDLDSENRQSISETKSENIFADIESEKNNEESVLTPILIFITVVLLIMAALGVF